MACVGYGIIGCGYVGGALADILTAMPGACVASVYDMVPANAAAVAGRAHADIAASAEALCASPSVDAVLIATPNALHVEPALAAAAHHKHIFCEKPVALSYADCLRMLQAARQHGVLFMAGHVMHFFRGVETMKQMLAQDRIGRILYCHAARNGWEDKQPAVSWKKMRAMSGGHLMHHIHELDYIISLMGVPRAVTMTGSNLMHRGAGYGDEDDMLFLLLEYENGTNALLEYGNAFRWNEHYVLVQGEKGAIRLDMAQVGGMLVKPGEEERFLVHETAFEDLDRTRRGRQSTMNGSIAYGHPGMDMPPWLHTVMEKEMAVLHQAVTDGRAPEAWQFLFSGDMLLNTMKTAQAALLSRQEGRKVDLRELEEKGKDL